MMNSSRNKKLSEAWGLFFILPPMNNITNLSFIQTIVTINYSSMQAHADDVMRTGWPRKKGEWNKTDACITACYMKHKNNFSHQINFKNYRKKDFFV